MRQQDGGCSLLDALRRLCLLLGVLGEQDTISSFSRIQIGSSRHFLSLFHRTSRVLEPRQEGSVLLARMTKHYRHCPWTRNTHVRCRVKKLLYSIRKLLLKEIRRGGMPIEATSHDKDMLFNKEKTLTKNNGHLDPSAPPHIQHVSISPLVLKAQFTFTLITIRFNKSMLLKELEGLDSFPEGMHALMVPPLLLLMTIS